MENFSNNAVDIETLPRFEEVDYQGISRKYLIKTNIQTSIFFFFLLIGWVALYFYGTSTQNLMLAMGGILFLFGFKIWNNFMMQPNYGFALREKDILYRRGFLVKSTTVIPFNRIQHASVSRDMMDKILNISSVQVFTAGGSSSDISIPGLKPELASRLKDALAKKLSVNGE